MAPDKSKPLVTIEEDLQDRFFVTIKGIDYFIRHRDDLGLGDLLRLDAIVAGYGHIMSMATGGKLDKLTAAEGDALDKPITDLCHIYLDHDHNPDGDFIDELGPRSRMTLVFAFNKALGSKPEPPAPNRAARRQATPSSGGKRSRRSAASTAATTKAG